MHNINLYKGSEGAEIGIIMIPGANYPGDT